jgi:hypothetical protein
MLIITPARKQHTQQGIAALLGEYTVEARFDNLLKQGLLFGMLLCLWVETSAIGMHIWWQD